MTIRDQIKEKLGDKILEWNEPSAKRIYLLIKQEDVVESVKFLFRELGLRFATASAMELPSGFEILYHFSFDKAGEFYSLRVLLKDKLSPEVESITPLFPGAEWTEREIWEMLGIKFKNHPNLKRLLLADDWPQDNYPLRQNK